MAEHAKYAEYLQQHPTEATRAEQQFELITQNIGYLVHPSIHATLPPHPVVADIGTGTGRFLTSLAAEYPGAELHGFDLTDALFAAHAPANVQLGVHDAREPFAAALHGRFDLVHLRTLVATLDAGDWARVLGHALALLKPGGALQWTEPNWDAVQILRGRARSTCAAARELLAAFRAVLAARSGHGWNELPGLMRAAGLERVEADIVGTDRVPDTRWALSVNALVGMCIFADIMARKGRIPLSEERVEALGTQGFVDVESGAYLRFDLHTAVGFKSTQ